MTELQTKVLTSIKSGTTDEEKAVLAVNAVRMWYWEQGYYSRSYQLDEVFIDEVSK